jgi:serine/threonine-protein kinase
MRADWPKAEASATALVNAALADDKAAALGLTLLADAIASQGGAAEAAEPIKQAIDLDGKLALAQAINSNILASQALDAHDDALMEQALTALDAAVDSLGDETPVVQALTHNALAYTFAQKHFLSGSADYLTQSEQSYAKAIDLQPKLALFHANLGFLLSASERYDQARAEFATALKLSPTLASAQTGVGWSYYRQGEKTKAADAFAAALAIAHNDAEALIGQGRLAFDGDDYGTAIARFASASNGNGRSADAYAWLGKAYQFSGFNNARADEQKQAYTSAEAAYRKAITINDRYAFAVSGLGWVLQYEEKYDASVDAFKRAIALDAGNDESHNGLGWSLFNLGRYKEAEPSFRKAITITPDYASPHYGLGRTLEELGRKDEARAEFQKALDIDPKYTDAKDALERIRK